MSKETSQYRYFTQPEGFLDNCEYLRVDVNDTSREGSVFTLRDGNTWIPRYADYSLNTVVTTLMTPPHAWIEITKEEADLLVDGQQERPIDTWMRETTQRFYERDNANGQN